MFTGRDPIIAEMIRQERLYEAEQHRLAQQLAHSRSRVPERVAALLRRARTSIAAPRPGEEAVARSRRIPA